MTIKKSTEKTTKKDAETPAASSPAAAKTQASQKAAQTSSRASKAAAGKASPQKPSDKVTPNTTKASAPSKPTSKGASTGFLWLLVLIVIGVGSITAGWPFIKPYVGDRVRTVVEDARQRLGLTPRPTQAQMPKDNSLDPAPIERAPVEATTASVETVPVETPVETPVEAAPVEVSAPVEATSPSFMELSNRLTALEDRLASLSAEGSGGNGQAALSATEELARTLSTVKSELTAANDRLDTMEKALKESQSARSRAAGTAQALVLAATQLRVRLMGDSSFSAELSALERIAGNDPDIRAAVNRLRPHAEVGVPSEAALIARFPAVAVAITRAGAVSGETGWMGVVKDSLSGLITVRRTDPEKITNALERALAVGEAALQLGDLDGAVQALSDLQGPAGDAALPWLGDARARISAEAALESLYNQALAAMAQASGS